MYLVNIGLFLFGLALAFGPIAELELKPVILPDWISHNESDAGTTFDLKLLGLAGPIFLAFAEFLPRIVVYSNACAV